MVYLKLRGRKKSLEGRMQPAGRTLAMSVIEVWYPLIIIIHIVWSV